jgi:hypothetical protein
MFEILTLGAPCATPEGLPQHRDIQRKNN